MVKVSKPLVPVIVLRVVEVHHDEITKSFFLHIVNVERDAAACCICELHFVA